MRILYEYEIEAKILKTFLKNTLQKNLNKAWTIYGRQFRFLSAYNNLGYHVDETSFRREEE